MKILIRKFNKDRKLYEIVFEGDSNDGYELGTGKMDRDGKPTFVGDIIEGDVHTELGIIQKKGLIQFDELHQQFICNFKGLEVFGSTLPVDNIKVIGNLVESQELLEEKVK